MMLVGAAIIVFKERIMRLYMWVHRFGLGIEFPENMYRSGTIFLGTLVSFYGLLILLRLVSIL